MSAPEPVPMSDLLDPSSEVHLGVAASVRALPTDGDGVHLTFWTAAGSYVSVVVPDAVLHSALAGVKAARGL